MAEEIIINDVDVTECKYYNKCSRDCEDNNVYDCVLCANIPNCHYKQLKRAERKLEKIETNCNETLSECSCKNPIIDIDCREYTSGGRVEKAKEILQIIEGNENE